MSDIELDMDLVDPFTLLEVVHDQSRSLIDRENSAIAYQAWCALNFHPRVQRYIVDPPTIREDVDAYSGDACDPLYFDEAWFDADTGGASVDFRAAMDAERIGDRGMRRPKTRRAV